MGSLALATRHSTSSFQLNLPQKLFRLNIKMSVIRPSHIERAVKFVSSSTKVRNEATVMSPISSASESDKAKLTEYQNQKTNKEDMLQKFPPKNILQKRFYTTTDHRSSS